MSKIDNSKLVLELLKHKKNLTSNQLDVDTQLNYHISLFQANEVGKKYSQRAIIGSLTERLKNLTFDSSVKNLLESVNDIIDSDELFYDLEELYADLERNDNANLYSNVLEIISSIINESNPEKQQYKIFTELKLYDWIKEVKLFLIKYTSDEREIENLTSDGGKTEPVYTVVEKVSVDNKPGYLAYVGDKWFYINESIINPKTPSELIDNTEKLRKINYLEKALRISTIKESNILFDVSDDLTLGVNIETGNITLNGDKVDKTTTLESIFNSPLIPFMRREMYPIISETINNLDKFMELDIVKKVSNITNPFLECFAFNHNDNIYLYSISKRYGNTFHQYDSPVMLVSEIKESLGFDLSNFYKDKMSKDVQNKLDIQDRVSIINSKIEELNEGISKLELSGLLEDTDEEIVSLVKEAHTSLLEEKTSLTEDRDVLLDMLRTNKYSI